MPLQRLTFSIDIDASPEHVHQRMLDDAGYREWTAAFGEGSHFVGSWAQGSRIRFIGPGGDGMVSEIAEHRPAQFRSIRHLGMIVQGQEDFDSEAVKAWAGALENYRFTATSAGTRLDVAQDMGDEWADWMRQTWPLALARLKALCERG